MRTGLDVLIEMKQLIEKPEHWGQYSIAQRQDGCPTTPIDPQAHSFCLLGAFDKATFGGWDGCAEANRTAKDALFKSLSQTQHRGSLATYNDTHTHSEVMSLIDNAMEIWKQENAQ